MPDKQGERQKQPQDFIRVDVNRNPKDEIMGIEIYLRNGVIIVLDPDSIGLFAFGDGGIIDMCLRKDKNKDGTIDSITIDGGVYTKSCVKAIIERNRYLESYFMERMQCLKAPSNSN